MAITRKTTGLVLAAGALLVGAAGLALWAIPAFGETPPMTASFTATDNNWNVTGSSSKTAVIAPGGTVSFAYPSGSFPHNANFDTGPAPTSCEQVPPGGPVPPPPPPLPPTPTAAPWSGSCTFNTQATYTFHCDAHIGMSATIVVSDTLPTAPPGTTPPAPSNPSVPTPGAANSLTGESVKLKSAQRGKLVKGSVVVNEAGSKLVIEARAGSTSLKSAGLARTQRVGRVVKTISSATRTSFSVRLNAKARSAIKAKGKLKLTVKISLTAPGGKVLTRTKSVTVRPSGG